MLTRLRGPTGREPTEYIGRSKFLSSRFGDLALAQMLVVGGTWLFEMLGACLSDLPRPQRHDSPLPRGRRPDDGVLREEFGNPSSVHHFGQRAKAVIDEARGGRGADRRGSRRGRLHRRRNRGDNLAIRGVAEALEPTGGAT